MKNSKIIFSKVFLLFTLLLTLLAACDETADSAQKKVNGGMEAMDVTSKAALESFYAITDVRVVNLNETPPDGYTGLPVNTMVNPYVSGVIGKKLTGSDVCKGIGGENVGIYVKYELISTSDQSKQILTNIAVTHWGCDPWGTPVTPDGEKCPYDGWNSANGSIGEVKGGLTPGTDGSCWCNGLVVQYKPLSEVSTFVTNLYLKRNENTAPSFPKDARANGGWWKMMPGTLDIHRACGDDHAYYVCKAFGKIAPPIPGISNENKAKYMKEFAPAIYMDKGENYFSSTVDFSFNYMTRYLNSDGKYWVKTREGLSSPSSTLPYFTGDFDNTKVYAFWVDKKDGVTEFTYFIFYPYNRGKEIIGTIWGNHVGDWEHVTVRLSWNYVDEWKLQPFEVYLSAHSGGHTRSWSEAPKTSGANQPIAYSARGSHAMYFEPGDHEYKDLGPLGELVDKCSKGKLLTLNSDNLVLFDYAKKEGLQGNSWPVWMSSDFSQGGSDPANPSSGPIFRWGNTEEGCTGPIGQCRLENGPTGPISKSQVWDPNVFEN